MPGPHVAVAVLCEHVIEAKDGSLSLIRIVDRVQQTTTGADVPAQMPPVSLDLWAVVCLRSDEARGRHTVHLRIEKPSGEQLQSLEFPVLFEGEERTVNLLIRLAPLVLDDEGLYWFDVLLGEVGAPPLTRIPLRVTYQPQRTAYSAG
jgi:hypothetical protein